MNRVSATLRKRVETAVTNYMKMAEKYYGRTLEHPTVLYTQRGTTAGVASYRGNIHTVNYNAVLLNENEEDFMARTVPHEVAHVIDKQINPQNFERQFIGYTRTGRARFSKRDVHGRDFQFIMERVLGVDDSTRCHSYDVTNARTRRKVRHVWVCDQRPDVVMKLGPKQHVKQLTYQRQGLTGYMPRGEGLRRGVHTFSYSHVDGQQPAPMPLAADGPKKETTTSHKRPERKARPNMHNRKTGTSKLDQCRELYSAGWSRQDNINTFVASAGCTPAGAATYYAKIKKEVG